MDGQTDGRNYIPPTSSGDNKANSSNVKAKAKVYFRETYLSQNINLISPTPKFTLGIIQIIVKSISTIFQCLVQ